MNRIMILGGAGFIGKNLALRLSENPENYITVVDTNKDFFSELTDIRNNIQFCEFMFRADSDYNELLKDTDVVYHLISTSMPSNTNKHIPQEIQANVFLSSYIFEACVQCEVKRVIFASSGGTVYGKDAKCPIKEDFQLNPITSYGIQKLTIEKLLYLYNYLYGLDYKVVRMSNPYGPYQRPNGRLGVITTFVYKALKNEILQVYGDGSVIRDYIYISDCIDAIINVSRDSSDFRIFNIGSGNGLSVNEVIDFIINSLNIKLEINYTEGRKVDVPINYLCIDRYERMFGKINKTSISDGIIKTADFLKSFYKL